MMELPPPSSHRSRYMPFLFGTFTLFPFHELRYGIIDNEKNNPPKKPETSRAVRHIDYL